MPRDPVRRWRSGAGWWRHPRCDRPGHRLGFARLRRTSRRGGGLVAGPHERRQVGHHRGDRVAGHERSEVEPVRPDVADRPERAALVRLEPPVPVALVEEPVLEVVAGHEPTSPRPPPATHLAGVLVQRIVADIEVDRVDEAGGGRRPDQRADSSEVITRGFSHTTWLAGGEDGAGLGDVEIVGRGHMDDVDAGSRAAPSSDGRHGRRRGPRPAPRRVPGCCRARRVPGRRFAAGPPRGRSR